MAEGTNIITEGLQQRRHSRLPLFTRFWLWLLGGFFAQIKFYKRNTATIQKALESGSVVHVMQYRSYLDYLVFNYFLRKHDMAPVFFPRETLFDRIWAFLSGRSSKRPVSFEKGSQSLIFLRERRTFLSTDDGKIDLVRDLLEKQKDLTHPIYLIPQITIWSRRPPSVTWSFWDMVLGNSTSPGKLRKILIFFRNYKKAFIKCDAPLDLTPYTDEEITAKGKDPVKELRWRVYQFFSEERIASTGPASKPRTWMLESVLHSKAVQEIIETIHKEEGTSKEELNQRATMYLDKMAADYHYTMIIIFSFFLRIAFRRLYDRIELIDDEIEMLRNLVKSNPVVYCPTHKSHIDYLLLSYLCNDHHLFPPHIIAGENLSFWPMGFLFGRAGAIFIKRSFRGNRLYTTCLRTYLGHMLMEGHSQEFFIEGTRSRTGKVLPPKLGILSMYVDACLAHPEKDVYFVPVNVTYDRLIEEQAYAEELHGGKKKKENLKQMMKIKDVLKLRLGSVFVKVGTPISLADFMAKRGMAIKTLTPNQRRELIQDLGYEVIWGINKETTVTPTSVVATALLSANSKGVSEKHLLEDVEIIINYLREQGAILSSGLDQHSYAITHTLDVLLKEGMVDRHLIGNEVIYTLIQARRSNLDYYKNNTVHFFVPPAIVAIAFRSFDGAKVSREELHQRAAFLAEMFRHEVNYAPESALEEVLNQAIDFFVSRDALIEDQAGNLMLGPSAERYRGFFVRVLANFLESYWVVAGTLPVLLDKRMSESKFLKKVMEEAKKLQLVGEIKHDEAYSKSSFQNAISYLVHRGVLIKQERMEDTTITVLPHDLDTVRESMNEDQKSKKKSKKKKKDLYILEVAEQYSTPDMLSEVRKEIGLFMETTRKFRKKMGMD